MEDGIRMSNVSFVKTAGWRLYAKSWESASRITLSAIRVVELIRGRG